MNEQAMRPSRMPIAPTDPRAFSRTDLPQPPTVNDSGMQSAMATGGAGPRVNSALFAENSSHRATNQKAFEGYRSTPATSPYTLLNANTDNGTINPYTAYVRPAQEQQQAGHDMDRADGAADQPAPLYPPAFQNYGSYFPTAH
jgi:hypothetical protein